MSGLNGKLSDMIACDSEREVKLTKYNILEDDEKLGKQQKSQNLFIDEGFKSLAVKEAQRSLNGAAGVTCREHFVIIWKQLSFQVDQSLYDRLINRLDMVFKRTKPRKKSEQQQQQQHDNLYKINSSAELCKHPSSDSRDLSDSHKIIRNNTKRMIFENLNGFIKSGQISAILGPSGAGKTSLLNALCGKVDNYRGTVQLIGGGSRKMRLSIIPQKDYLMENLTVKETLSYSSEILNTAREFDHETHILNIVRMLNLTDCFESRVSNISGGEYKRVSIAQELLKQPDLLILDEPTSGLDSLNCSNLIESLNQLIDASRRGYLNPIAIVMTIHQPDVEVFHMFDHVYCMARRGRVIYDGHPNDVMEVLKSQLMNTSKYEEVVGGQSTAVNPATLLIRIASENIYGQEVIDKLAKYQRARSELEIKELCRNDKQSPGELHEQLIAILNTKQSGSDNFPFPLRDSSSNQKNEQSECQLIRDKRLSAKKDNDGKFWYHTKVLARRAFKSTIRDLLMTVVSFMFHLLIPFVMWIVYPKEIGDAKSCPILQRDLDTISMISNHTTEKMILSREEFVFSAAYSSLMFITSYSLSLCSIAITSLAFPLNMHVLLKEVRNGWYNLPSFIIAKTIANFPFEVLFPVMSQMIAFMLIGMPPSYLHWRFWAMALIIALLSIISHSYGLIFGALFMDSLETAIFMALSLTVPLVALSGFLSRIETMPKLLQYLSWLSPYQYSINSLNIIRFGYGICPCDDSTEEYLKTHEPNFLDIRESMKSLFTYYITSNAQDHQQVAESRIHISGGIIENSTLTDITITPFGISNELTISGIERSDLISKIETNEIDALKRLADLMVRSFTFGREVTTCETVRSDFLSFYAFPPDRYLPYFFSGMILLMISLKTLLFIIVHYRIRNRV